MPDLLKQYYIISEILQDDTHKVATVIHTFATDHQVSAIVYDLKKNRESALKKYEDALDAIMSLPKHAIIETSKGLEFKNRDCYISYLHELLELSNIPYAPYIQADYSKPQTQGLF